MLLLSACRCVSDGPLATAYFLELRVCEVRRIPIPRTPVNKGKKRRAQAARDLDPTGACEAFLLPWRRTEDLRSISATSGSSSGWGGTVLDLAGSPISLMRPSRPAGEKMNNSLAGPESTVKAWGTSLGPKR